MSDFLRKHLLGLVGGVALAIGAVGIASAAPVFGTISTAGGNNGVEHVYPTDTRAGQFSRQLFLSSPTTLVFEYLGSEAGNINDFYFQGERLFSTPGTTGDVWNTTPGYSAGSVNPVTRDAAPLAGGLLDFSFKTTPAGETTANGANDIGNHPNWFISFDLLETAISGTSLVLWLDDGGAGPDDNHDDMAIRVSIKSGSPGTFSTVPLPAAVWLMLAGVGGLGAVAARRRKSANAA